MVGVLAPGVTNMPGETARREGHQVQADLGVLQPAPPRRRRPDRPPQPLALGKTHRLKRRFEGGARLDFDRGQHLAAPDDQVDLAVGVRRRKPRMV